MPPRVDAMQEIDEVKSIRSLILLPPRWPALAYRRKAGFVVAPQAAAGHDYAPIGHGSLLKYRRL